jgi:hypothetical protein
MRMCYTLTSRQRPAAFAYLYAIQDSASPEAQDHSDGSTRTGCRVHSSLSIYRDAGCLILVQELHRNYRSSKISP